MNTNVIISPIISEKSMNEAGKGKFTFRVKNFADKKAIRKEVEERFKVNVLKVSTITIKGRTARAGTRRTEVKKPAFKKAVLTLRAGEKIALFDTAG
jgi:large subunit ribosomal protein L23